MNLTIAKVYSFSDSKDSEKVSQPDPVFNLGDLSHFYDNTLLVNKTLHLTDDIFVSVELFIVGG